MLNGEVATNSVSYNSNGTIITTSFIFNWNATQSIDNNKSTVNWSLIDVQSPSGYYRTVRNRYVTIDGKTTSATSAISAYNGTVVLSGSTEIGHNSDGTKTFDVSIGVAVGQTGYNCTASTSFALNTIPRASKLNNTGYFYLQDGFKLNYTSYSSNFYQKVKLTLKGTNKSFLSIAVDNGEQLSYSEDVFNYFMESFPTNSNQAVFIVELLTYLRSNNTLIGTDIKELIGLIKPTSGTIPTINGSIKTYEKNETILKLTNEERYIKDYSNLNVILDEIPSTKYNSTLDRIILNDMYRMNIYTKTLGNNIEMGDNLNSQIIKADFFIKEDGSLTEFISYEEMFDYYNNNKDRIIKNTISTHTLYESNLIPVVLGDEGENESGPYGIYFFASDNPTLQNGKLGIVVFGDIARELDDFTTSSSYNVLFSIGLVDGKRDSIRAMDTKIKILDNFSKVRGIFKGSIYDRLSIGEGSVTKQIAEYTIDKVNTQNVKVMAIDSRGLSSFKTSSVEMIADYHIPLINNIKVNRTNGVEETAYLSFNVSLWKGNFGNGNNTITECKYRVKKSNSSSYSDWFDVTGEIKVAIENQEVDNLSISNIQLFSDEINANFDFGQEYDIELYIVDGITGTKFNSSGNVHVMLDDGLVLDNYVKNNDGYQIAFNGMVDKSLKNGAQFYGAMYLNGVEITPGSGGGSSGANVVDNLNSTSTTSALSANQGRILNQKIENIEETAGTSIEIVRW